MKTLVVLAHPNIETSRINKGWMTRLESEEHITIHNIYKEYPDMKIDVKKEQQLVESHERIVFEFPFYWYNAPALLKLWQDEVFAFGFSHGPNGNKLVGKEFMLAISAGGQEEAYRAGGMQRFTISELTKTFENMASFTKMNYKPAFVAYDAHNLTDEKVRESAEALANLLTK